MSMTEAYISVDRSDPRPVRKEWTLPPLWQIRLGRLWLPGCRSKSLPGTRFGRLERLAACRRYLDAHVKVQQRGTGCILRIRKSVMQTPTRARGLRTDMGLKGLSLHRPLAILDDVTPSRGIHLVYTFIYGDPARIARSQTSQHVRLTSTMLL